VLFIYTTEFQTWKDFPGTEETDVNIFHILQKKEEKKKNYVLACK